jgi:RNA polymerase sigma factor (sigma-70 family)
MASDLPDFTRLPDADVLDWCSRHEPRAWRELVRRYRRLVFGIPQAMGLQAADADEVFQQTFSALLRDLPKLRDPDRLEAWLVTTSRRAALRLLRSERRRRRLAEDSVMDTSRLPGPVDPAEEIELLRRGERLRRAVESLGEPCRTIVFGLFASPPRPYREMARELGLAAGSLGPTRGRCLERLRSRLDHARDGRTDPDLGAKKVPARGSR